MSFCSLIKRIAPKNRILCVVLINKVLFNRLCVLILSVTSYDVLQKQGKGLHADFDSCPPTSTPHPPPKNNNIYIYILIVFCLVGYGRIHNSKVYAN